MTIDMQEILQMVADRSASDLHLKAGQPPIIRVAGKLIRSQLAPLDKEEIQRLIFSILTPDQKKTLEETLELDMSYGLDGIGRFRVNVYRDRGTYAAALRMVPSLIPTLEELGLPPIVKEIAQRPRGLVLITGPTGSGKSTTLASMIDWINTNRADHILTIEDPIEFIHTSKRSVVSQRELGSDTHSFANALRAALREDPDVILVGEMRDLETIHLALTAAETGHLVFGTVHTSSALQTIDRVIDVFPPAQQQQIRIMLSNGLVAVVSQTLLPRLTENVGGAAVTRGRVLAVEVLINNTAVANLIREAKTAQLYSTMQMGGNQGMQTLESSLAGLVKNNIVSDMEALAKTSRPDDLEQLIASGSRGYAQSGMKRNPNPGFGSF
ncbi:MAG TPA: type IV pilus twitching motility protein PilT [Candidatus Obscuribacterales bacterium]